MRTLVVDGSPTTAEQLAETLGQSVDIEAMSHTEDEALAVIAAHELDLVITELHLAQGTGFGVIRRARAARRPSCIVVFTNYAVPALKVAAFEAGADYFLDKSKGFQQVQAVVAALLEATERAEQRSTAP